MTARAPKSISNFRLNLDKANTLERGTPAAGDLFPFYSNDAEYGFASTLENLSGALSGITIGTGTNNLPASQSGATYSNGSGALVTFNLPPAEDGLVFSFIVNDYTGTKIVAAGTDRIHIASIEMGAAGGYILSTTVGSYITLRAITTNPSISGSPVEWLATLITGTWNMDVT